MEERELHSTRPVAAAIGRFRKEKRRRRKVASGE